MLSISFALPRSNYTDNCWCHMNRCASVFFVVFFCLIQSTTQLLSTLMDECGVE